MPPVTLARHAMATRFELVLPGDNPTALRAAGEEALDEIDRLENQLSLYRPGSEIAQVNARAAREPVRVTPQVFALLKHAQRLHAETGGAFDITIAPLVRCWGFMGGRQLPSWEGSGAGWSAPATTPTAEEVAEARSRVGMQHVLLDEQNRTVRFDREGVMLDLGAIGKGYAVDQAAELLRAAGVKSALVHGGTSTVCAIGRPPDGDSWKLAIEQPVAGVRSSAFTRSGDGGPAEAGTPDRLPSFTDATGFPQLPALSLRDEAMSVSAVWGRSFVLDGKVFGHVIDPRTGRPVNHGLLSVVVLPSATETDALSTALLTLGGAGCERIGQLRPGMKTLFVARDEAGLRVQTRGIEAGRADVSAS